MIKAIGCVGLLAGSICGQAFEAASVRASAPAPPGGNNPILAMLSGRPTIVGGPGSADPERLTLSHVPLRMLLWTAYAVRPDQISGPAWLDSETFDISAKVAPGTTKEQSNLMLQNLLVERFKVTLHHGTKEDAQAYELIAAKSGSKLKAVTPDPKATKPQPGEFMARLDLDQDGFPVFPANRIGILGTRTTQGLYRMTCHACAIAELIERLGVDLAVAVGSPPYFATAGRVVDKTGLAAKYDFHLEYLGGGVAGQVLQPPPVDAGADSGPDLFTALEKQLGLKLQKARVPLDVLVIDHIERVPVEN